MRRKKYNQKNKNGFRSQLEEKVWVDLKKKKGRRKHPEIQFESEKIPYVLVKRYLPDIILTKSDGSKLFIEVKGYMRAEDRQKMRAVKQTNPDLDIRFVFGNNNIIPGTKMTTSEWAERNGFPWAIREVPREWLK